ncbi:hypothetical protein KI387_026158, partial [Taxus chinensis]
LPGDSGRLASEIHGFPAEAVLSPQRIYRRAPPQSPVFSNNGVRNERSVYGNTP